MQNTSAVSPKPKIHVESRAGKKVTVIRGLHTYGQDRLEKTAIELKAFCAAGGTVKNGAIEIQGDNTARINAFFRRTSPAVKEQSETGPRFINEIRITKFR